MISLNIKTITDEIFALTALRGAVTGSNDLPPLLTRDHLPALRVVIRSAFATMATRLHPYIADSSVEDGNPLAEQPYDDHHEVTLDLDFGQHTSLLSGGETMVLKRHLEHLLALNVLQKIYLPIDESTAAQHASEAAALIPVITDLLTSPLSTTLLTPCYI